MKKLIAAIAIYVLGGFFTNAYCQLHRWNDWEQVTLPGYRSDQAARVRTLCATVAWPGYWLSRSVFWVVENPPYAREESSSATYACEEPSSDE